MKNRLISLLLTMVLCFTLLPFSAAQAITWWVDLIINVHWIDAQGNPQFTLASPIPDDPNHAHWVQLDPSLLGTTLTVEVVYPDDQYSFYFNDWSLNHVWMTDAPAADLQYAQHIAYSIGDVLTGYAGNIPIYFSSKPVPGMEGFIGGGSTSNVVSIPVYYVTEDGAQLDVQYVQAYVGQYNTVWATSDKVSGYELVGGSSIDVYADAAGSTSPSQVKFVYRAPVQSITPAPAAEVVIPVYYVHMDGRLLDQQQLTFGEGAHTIYASSAYVEGLEIVGASQANVTVWPDGYTDIASVTFTYQDPYVEVLTPVPVVTDAPSNPSGPEFFAPSARANVPVYYVHVNGWSIDFQEIKLEPGYHTVRASSKKTSGYLPVGSQEIGVTVYQDGSTDLASISFYYEDAAPVWTDIPTAPPAPEKIDLKSGFGLVTASNVNLREGPSTDYSRVGKLAHDTLVSVQGAQRSGSYIWYLVSAEGMTGYMRGDYLDLMDERELAQYYGAQIKPTNTPEPTDAPVFSAFIPVYYYNADSRLLDMQELELAPGPHAIRPDSKAVSGLTLTTDDVVYVTVYPDGSSDVASVSFWYEEPAPVKAELTVMYMLEDGTQLDAMILMLSPGEHSIYPESLKTMNLIPVGESVQRVYVDKGGTAAPNPVVFTFREKTASVTVHYQDDRGRDVAPAQTLTLKDGAHTITANPDGLSDDLQLAPGSVPATVTVKDGKASMADVYFYYEEVQREPDPVRVTVHYYDTLGNVIAGETVIELPVGTHQVTPAPKNLPADYELASEPSIDVTVYQDGSVSHQELAFYYRPVNREAAITVRYQDAYGEDIADSAVIKRTDGVHLITPDAGRIPEGWEPLSGAANAVEVTVSGGVASQDVVVFRYQMIPVATPVTFNIPVYYLDTMGKEVASTQHVPLSAGDYTISANPADLPEGYELMSERPSQQVRVHEDGTTSPERIEFYYRAPIKNAVVTVYLLDADGALISGPFTVELPGGSYSTVKLKDEWIPSTYESAGETSVRVYVSRDGAAEPASINFLVQKKVVETPIPVGEQVYRYATVNAGKVAFRSEPGSDRKDTVIRRVTKGDVVFVLKELYNAQGEQWAMLNVNGYIGYMDSRYVDIMSSKESEAYAKKTGATPVPTFTPTPSPSPVPTPTQKPTESFVEVITPPPTSTPTLEPLPTETITPSPTPTASPTATPYSGYALTSRSTALRTGISSSDISIIHNMEAGELVLVSSQLNDASTGANWSIVTTLRGQSGFVQSDSLRYITEREAKPYLDMWEQLNATAQPTELITATPVPEQVQGLAYAIGDNVPLRQMSSEFSNILETLSMGDVVYIAAQTWVDGVAWHSVQFENRWGYIRSDMVRLMTEWEENAYLSGSTEPTPTLAITNRPFDEDGLSSYGYVSGSSVNMRKSASTNSSVVRELKRYAFCLVLGTEKVDGQTWYRVRYNGESGYVRGDYFKHLTMSEAMAFTESEQYRQGITANQPDRNPDDEGYTGMGGMIPAEDQTMNQWQDPNSGVQVSYAPFNPVATVKPIPTATPTLEPLPGAATNDPTSAPTSTPTFNPLPDVTWPGDSSAASDDDNTLVWVVVIALLLLTVGGVFCVVQYQQKRRRMALRAAQRRAQAARAAQQQPRPYARSGAQTPRTAAYPDQTQARRPVNQGTATYAPYSGEKNPYAQTDDAEPTVRTGRRTARRPVDEEE